MHLWVWRGVTNALIERPNVRSVAPVFFGLTLRAHIDEAFLHLARLVEKRNDVLSLWTLLKCVDSNAAHFKGMKAEEVRRQLLPAMKKSVRAIEERAAAVRNRRNKLLAHFTLDAAMDFEGVAKEFEVTVGEMVELYEEAGSVVNNILGPYQDALRLMEVVGWDDFKFALDRIERGQKARREELLARARSDIENLRAKIGKRGQ